MWPAPTRSGALSRPAINENPSWLRAQVEDLTTHTERACSEPWAVSDAPADDIAALVKTIIGIRIEVSRLEGAWEMIQHHPEKTALASSAGD